MYFFIKLKNQYSILTLASKIIGEKLFSFKKKKIPLYWFIIHATGTEDPKKKKGQNPENVPIKGRMSSMAFRNIQSDNKNINFNRDSQHQQIKKENPKIPWEHTYIRWRKKELVCWDCVSEFPANRKHVKRIEFSLICINNI